jgi:hypothetical protein
MDSVRKRVMRFSPALEEAGEGERPLLPAIVLPSAAGLQEATKRRRVSTVPGAEQEFRDIVSVTIVRQLWHVADTIFKHLDAVSLLHCEKVSPVALLHFCDKVWHGIYCRKLLNFIGQKYTVVSFHIVITEMSMTR